MSVALAEETQTASRKVGPRISNLNDLVSQDLSQLDALFRSSPAPKLEEVSGEYDGRVLVGPYAPLNNLEFVKLINSGGWLPWKGKLFTPQNKLEALGQNRLEIGPFKTKIFGFNADIRPSVFSGDDCYVLDYDRPDNPAFIQPIRDEMKKIKDNLFLGRANFRVGAEWKLVIYFALGCG